MGRKSEGELAVREEQQFRKNVHAVKLRLNVKGSFAGAKIWSVISAVRKA